MMTPPKLLWDWGTAYDLFVSLVVLHKPAGFGVRGAWAAGVRARLPAEARETLEQSRLLWSVPFHWIHSLPEPKNGAVALWALGQVPPAERLPLLALGPGEPEEVAETLRGVAEQGAWDEQDREALRIAYEHACECQDEKHVPNAEKLGSILDLWVNAKEMGERYLEALRAYQESFFAEEERRIQPALQGALARAQERAPQLPVADLLEEISQGLRFDVLPETDVLVLVPSYWCTPLVMFGQTSGGGELLLFGARPADESLVPGEMVPEMLMRRLKALSDPTRLRIMRVLFQESQTPAQLARGLRLRAPTVTHHLKVLRLAGLVQLTLGEGKTDRSYAARSEAVMAACDSLKSFFEPDDQEDRQA